MYTAIRPYCISKYLQMGANGVVLLNESYRENIVPQKGTIGGIQKNGPLGTWLCHTHEALILK